MKQKTMQKWQKVLETDTSGDKKINMLHFMNSIDQSSHRISTDVMARCIFVCLNLYIMASIVIWRFMQ